MANHCRHFLQQNLVTPDQETRLQCLKTIGCPAVKYVSSFWDPVGNKQLQCQLEQEQKKAGGMNPTGTIKAVLVTWYRTLACTEFLSCQKRNCTPQNVAQHLLQKKNSSRFSPTKDARCANIRFKPVTGSVQAYSNSFVPLTSQE